MHKKISKEKNVIRKVKRQDSKGVWKIRSHSFNRKYFGKKERIPFNYHDKWFENKYFKSQDNKCFVLKKEKKVIGYCRFDLENGKYRISIAIDPQYHGKGLGHILFSTSLKKIRTKRDILAEIQLGNLPSVKLFQKNNFEIYRQDDKNYYLKYKA
jgi:ribosomal protein S18 acetylase RimI-like enzyme